MKGKLLTGVVVLAIAVALLTWALLARTRLRSQRFDSPHTVKLTWLGSAGALTYNVYRSQTSETYGSPLVTGLTLPSYTDGAVVAGQTYFYAVTAVNASGESAKSKEIRVDIPSP